MANPVITTLTNYIQQERLPLISKAVLGAKSASMFTPQSGIKTSGNINLLTTDVKFQDGLTCGFQDAGTSTLTARTINTGNIKVNMEFCDRTMLEKWTQYQLNVAANKENMPFEEQFVNGVLEDIQSKLETAIWQGDTTSDNENLKWFDGLLKIAEADNSINKVTIAGTSAYDDIMKVYAAIPEVVLDKAVIFVGADKFRSFTTELVAKNLYHYDGNAVGGEIYFPGTNTKVVKVNGLNGTGKIFAARPEDLFVGYDMRDDAEEFKFWYSEDHQAFRLVVKFNLGVQYDFSEFVTLGKTA